MYKCGGFVLITALIFLQLFSLLGLYSLMHAVQMLKITGQFWEKEKYHAERMQLLQRIETISENKLLPCLADTTLPTLTKHALLWWQQYGCHGKWKYGDYYYVIQILGEDNCAYFQLDSAEIAWYQRITLMLLTNRSHPQVEFLQSTITLPHNPTDICLYRMHKIEKGRQSIRAYTAINKSAL